MNGSQNLSRVVVECRILGRVLVGNADAAKSRSRLEHVA